MQLAKLNVGQHSIAGLKSVNQDYCGSCCPIDSQGRLKGQVLVIADGIGSSTVSQVASKAAVNSFLQDYYATSDAWSVETSATRVMQSINAWLHGYTKQSEFRYDLEKGYVCTFSALIIKGSTAHIFHVGDARVYLLRQGGLEQLSNDHRQYAAQGQSYLSRALGMHTQLDIDYVTLPICQDDIFILCTDGVHEYLSPSDMLHNVTTGTAVEGNASANLLAEGLVQQALANGSDDNLSLQVVKVTELIKPQGKPITEALTALPLPPMLQAGQTFDGYHVIRSLHVSARSHVYLVEDQTNQQQWVLKTPSVDLSDSDEYLERFCLEEWIGRRMHNPHVLNVPASSRPKQFIYSVAEYVQGQSLRQWMTDNPKPELEAVRNIIEQIGKGLQAFHRLDMLHQDIRPENIMIDLHGTVKIIDFGSTTVAGLQEVGQGCGNNELLGTALYMAPEYFLGEVGTPSSDLFSLAVLAYHMLTGRFPYETHVSKTRTRSQQNRLIYQSVRDDDSVLPAWLDATLHKALRVDPFKRYAQLSEFIHDLRHPNADFVRKSKPPIMERNPVAFWQCVASALLISNVYFIYLFLT
ncbi:bifunctional protein-serine/threonine kinase/phosphatase [Paraglaciecola polaris]|uniref:Phosphatase 2C-like protein kinase n=1 Tax=Paraglaciecola polaris LMG 21857 TaxID=1129793 RepID=K6ZPH1_9ALTE|nr:bifunctional protein-serine/threonine kinase/phosphatase [Paraglaciecola polaris]GAC32192.1 phosphatase 2C-like protein kinase [Paraglaciecola polaris LMG 21857]